MGAKRGASTDIHTDERIRKTATRLISIFDGNENFPKLSAALADCGHWLAALRIGLSGCEQVFRNQCRQRICPRCATLKGARHRAGLERVVQERMAARAHYSLMTLTIPHTASDPLKKSLGILFKALTLFRKTAFFDKHIHGWARGIEVTWNAKNGYHPHAHYVVEARFMRLDALHHAWAKCVRKAGGGEVARTGVDLVGLKDSNGINEAIGYPFKVQALAEWPQERVIELAAVTKGRRLYQACMKWSRRIKALSKEARDLAAIECPSAIVPFTVFLNDLRFGVPGACEAAPSAILLARAVVGVDESVRMLEAAFKDGQSGARRWAD